MPNRFSRLIRITHGRSPISAICRQARGRNSTPAKFQLRSAKTARDITRTQYERGAGTLIDLLDAQRTYIATNVEYIQDLTSYWTAVSQLEQAVGMELRQ